MKKKPDIETREFRQNNLLAPNSGQKDSQGYYQDNILLMDLLPRQRIPHRMEYNLTPTNNIYFRNKSQKSLKQNKPEYQERNLRNLRNISDKQNSQKLNKSYQTMEPNKPNKNEKSSPMIHKKSSLRNKIKPINEGINGSENHNSLNREGSKELKDSNLKKSPTNLSPNDGLLSKNTKSSNFKTRRKSNKNSNGPKNETKPNLEKVSKHLPTEVINIEHSKKANIFTNTNPVIQVDQGISVSENSLKPKFQGLSKSCKNIHYLNRNKNSDLRMLELPNNYDINVAFFSDDDNEKIPKIKILYSLLKKYKNIDEKKKIWEEMNRKKMQKIQEMNLQKQLEDQKLIKNSIGNLKNIKLQRTPLNKSDSKDKNETHDLPTGEKSKAKDKKDELNKSTLPIINEGIGSPEKQKTILAKKKLKPIEKKFPLNQNNIISSKKNKNDELPYKELNKYPSNFRRKNFIPNNTIKYNGEGKNIKKFQSNLNTSQIKNQKYLINKKNIDINVYNNRNNSFDLKVDYFVPIQEDFRDRKYYPRIEDESKLSPEDKSLRRYQYWYNIVYPTYFPNASNRKHIELEMNSFISHRQNSPRFKFVGLSDLIYQN